MSRRLVNRADAVVLAVLVGVLLLAAAVTWDQAELIRDARARLRHDAAIISTLRDVDLAMRDAEAEQRGFLLTGGDAELGAFGAAAGQVPPLLLRLDAGITGQGVGQQRLRALLPPLRHRLDVLAQAVRLRGAGQDAAAVALTLGGAGMDAGAGAGRALPVEAEARLRVGILAETQMRDMGVAATDRRAASFRGLMVAVLILALSALLWAARMLNRAWRDASRSEAGQRAVALQLRASLDSLSQGVAVFDPVHGLSSWNACFQTLLGLPDDLLVAGTPYAALAGHAGGDEPPLLEGDGPVRQHRAPSRQPAVYERVQGGGQQLELRRSPMPGGGFVLTVSDMTERARAEAVLREAQKMQAIGQLTGGIAHDFNNLLTVILGNLELARNRFGADSALRTRIERATWAAQRGAALTAQLLAVARKQPLAPASIDLAASMPELIPLLRRTLGEHIEIGFTAADGLWPAMADPAQLENAVLNLALNARDAMPDGGRLLIAMDNGVLDERDAAAHHEVVAGDYVVLAVSDSGHGMAPEVLARVFEPFFTTKPDGQGTGLGLPMVFGFVKQSGGHVRITSEVGRGTIVRLFLPRATDADAASPPPSRRPEAVSEVPRGSATVLVVEDEQAVRDIAVAILRDLGYRVLEAEDGEGAMRSIAAHGPVIALLLTDVVLPGRLRGRELARQALAARPGLRVLFMSGYTADAITHDGRLDAGVRLISKPFQREELARRVAEELAPNDGAAGGGARPVADAVVDVGADAGAARLTFAPSACL